MKFKILHFVILLCCALISFTGLAQTFSKTYDFSGVVASANGKIDPTAPPTTVGLTFGSFTAVGSMSANPNAGGRFSFTAWPTGATNGSNTFTGSINTGQYYEVTLTPVNTFSLSLSSITFTLQRSSTGIRQYAVRSSIDNFASNLPGSISNGNSVLQVVTGNIFQIDDASSTAQDGSTIIINNVNNVTGPVTFRFYGWNAEASGGTFSIDNVVFNGQTSPSAGSPALTVNASNIVFPATTFNSNATVAYTIKGENLTDAVSITTATPFTVSENGTDFNSTLSIPISDVATDKTIYIKFSPTSVGSFTGTTSNASTNAFTRTINLQGDGIDPLVTSFDFNTCTAAGLPGGGFTAYSLTGAQKWACSSFGRSSTNGVDINGYSGGPQDNEDWLISPPLNLSTFANIPVLSFYSKGEYSGPKLELFVSTDYDGFSSPNTATWTSLNGNFPAPPGGTVSTFTLSDNINLSAYKTFPKVYLAFKYTSSVALGAARWTLDDIAVNDKSTIFSVSPVSLNFGEVIQGASSVSQSVSFQSIGFGDVTLTTTGDYKLSLDNSSFSNSVIVPDATASTGTTVYVQFAPASKQLKIDGQINFAGAGLNQNAVSLTGSSYPKSQTLDVACYNLSFFGSNSTNNPTQAKIDLQVANITTVIQHMNMDIIGVEEVSNSTALQTLWSNLPGYDTVISQRWSYSFNGPDPSFPPQKVGFIYNTNTMHLVEQRVMFEKLYDDVRTGVSAVMNDYPTGTPSSFWSSGRLPFMATFDVNINGVTKRIRFIDIHAKSAGDVDSYNRRVYDVKVLKDTLDTYYKDDNIVLVGDYNDRIFSSIYTATTISPYIDFKNEAADYNVLTYDLDAAGSTSFPGDVGMIDHIIISNELQNSYIPSSIQIEPANTYISNYGANTASDHLPVIARFDLSVTPLPIRLSQFNATPKNKTVVLSWITATEINNDHFVVERSADGKTFSAIAIVKGAGNSNSLISYQTIDQQPYNGKNYYRLRQVDIDGRSTLSSAVVVNFSGDNFIRVYPNPVTTYLKIEGSDNDAKYSAKISSVDGRVILYTSGNLAQVNTAVNQKLSAFTPGVYILELNSDKQHLTQKFMKQ